MKVLQKYVHQISRLADVLLLVTKTMSHLAIFFGNFMPTAGVKSDFFKTLKNSYWQLEFTSANKISWSLDLTLSIYHC